MKKILHYIGNNYKAILKESLWTFIILVCSHAIGNADNGGKVFGDHPVKYISFLVLVSIPGGIGSHLIHTRLFKNKK